MKTGEKEVIRSSFYYSLSSSRCKTVGFLSKVRLQSEVKKWPRLSELFWC